MRCVCVYNINKFKGIWEQCRGWIIVEAVCFPAELSFGTLGCVYKNL